MNKVIFVSVPYALRKKFSSVSRAKMKLIGNLLRSARKSGAFLAQGRNADVFITPIKENYGAFVQRTIGSAFVATYALVLASPPMKRGTENARN